MTHHHLALLISLALMACARDDLAEPPVDFGDFRLGHNVVVAKNAQAIGPSRKATPAEWEAALTPAIAARLGRYTGDKLYHLAVGVDGYALAVPGVPLVLSPKSALVLTVNLFDDDAAAIINAEPKHLVVFEGLSGETVLGSGLTRSRQEQIAVLSENAARAIVGWLDENKAWFTPDSVAARAAASAAPAPSN